MRVTRLGWGAAAMALLTLMAAGSTANNLLYLLFSTIVSAFAVSAAAGRRNLRRVEAAVEAPGQLFRGGEFPLKITLVAARGAAFGVSAVWGERRAGAPVVSAGAAAPLELRAKAARRGWNLLEGLALESAFPFGLLRHRRALPAARVLALPRLSEVHAASEVRADARAAGRPTLRKGSGEDLYGLRPYDPSDDVRRINWKVSARAGKPLVNEYCESFDGRVTVTVPAARGEDAERRIEDAACACRFYVDSGVEVRLVTPESEVGFGKGLLHLDRLLGELAVLGDGRSPRSSPAPAGKPAPPPADGDALRVLSALCAALVYAAVFLIDDVNPRLWLCFLPVLALGARAQVLRRGLLPAWLWDASSLAMLGYSSLVDWRANGIIPAVMHVLMYLLAYTLLNPLEPADLGRTALIYFLAFFLVSGLSISPWYFLYYLGYAALTGTWLWLAAGGRWPARRLWLGAVAGWLGAGLALSVVLFAAIPRTEGLRRINPILAGLDKLKAPASVSGGFTENVTLGWFGELKRSSARVMRVRPLAAGEGRPAFLRIRGPAYDVFDGLSWKKELADFRYQRGRRLGWSTGGRGWALRRAGQLRFPVPPPTGSPPAYDFTIFPMGLSVLFTVGTPWFVGGVDDAAYFDYTDSVYLATPYLGGVNYKAYSSVSGGETEAGLVELDEALRLRYLALPPDPSGRLAALARTAAGSAEGDEARAKAVEKYLRSHYSYSTFSDSRGRPLADFLFSTRKGNCEYFASAGVVLLRELGIPARLVTGFLVDEWNEYGRFYDVRQHSAHAWAQAYLPGRGWTTIDPTPGQSAFSASADALSRRLGRWFDAVQGEWYRTVIGYDQYSQRNTFSRLSAVPLNAVYGWLRRGFALLAAGWAAWGIASLILGARRRLSRSRGLDAYGRAEALLARAGLSRPPHLTPREYAAWLSERRPDLSELSALAELHYLRRYAGRKLSSQESGEEGRLLGALGGRL